MLHVFTGSVAFIGKKKAQLAFNQVNITQFIFPLWTAVQCCNGSGAFSKQTFVSEKRYVVYLSFLKLYENIQLPLSYVFSCLFHSLCSRHVQLLHKKNLQWQFCQGYCVQRLRLYSVACPFPVIGISCPIREVMFLKSFVQIAQTYVLLTCSYLTNNCNTGIQQ